MINKRHKGILFLLTVSILILIFSLRHSVFGDEVTPSFITTAPNHRYSPHIPIYDVRQLGYEPLVIDAWQSTAHFSTLADGIYEATDIFDVIPKTAPAYLSPGATAHYEIILANSESITRTYQLTDTLPSQLTFVPDSAPDLAYDPATRTLTWKGEVKPGNLEMVIEESGSPFPYLDLDAFGVPNLCDDFLSNEGTCNDVTVTFNLGVNGYRYTLYGETLSQITLSSNGIVLGSSTDLRHSDAPQWLPNPASPSFLLAGLWRDVDMGSVESGVNGRFHAAILSGLIEGHDVFYAQWHDVPHALDPDQTARHAIAIVLDGVGGMDGHAFFIYDNIANPTQTIAHGYAVGVEDKLGERGVTYAYAGSDHSAQGAPPETGTTLHLRPVLFGNDYTRTFTYDAIVIAQVPETIVNTAVVTTDSLNPAFAKAWSTHYLSVRHQLFLPFAASDGS